MNSAFFHLFYLSRFYWETRCLKILSNTVALNSYLGFSALRKNFFGLYKILENSPKKARALIG